MLKRIITCIFVVHALFSCKPKAPEGPFPLEEGTQLIYEVNNQDVSYQFIAEIQKISQNGIDFNWKMTSPVNYSGSISMTEEALKNANKLFNYFTNNSNLTLTDQTSVFLSRKVFDELVSSENRAMIDVGMGEDRFIRRNEVFKGFKILVDGKETELEYHDANNDEYVIRFTKIGDYPLIIEMHLDFSISLKEVKTK